MGEYIVSDDLTERLERVYSAAGQVVEHDLNKLRAHVFDNEKVRIVAQDFRGQLTDGELANHAYNLVHNVANLKDHLGKWIAFKGLDRSLLDNCIKNSSSLKIVFDLSNNDKHGYPPRNGGHSGQSPKLVEICKVMRLSKGKIAGSSVVMTVGANGVPIIAATGGGSAKAVITGDIVDSKNQRIGDLNDILFEAIGDWQRFLDLLASK